MKNYAWIDNAPPVVRPRLQKFKGVAPRIHADASAGEVLLYGPIDDYEGISDSDFAAALQEIGRQPVTVRINSPGGSAFMGVSIFNMLRRHPATVTTHVDGLAASAAAIVYMGGSNRTLDDGALLMVHSAWSITIGNAQAHDKSAATLRQIDNEIASIFAKGAGQPLAKVRQWLEQETWFNALEAADAGFTTTSAGASNRAASWRANLLRRRQQLLETGL